MYWINLWLHTVCAQQNIFEKTHIEIYSQRLYSSFGTFCIQIGQSIEAQCVFKHSEEFEVGDIFLWNRLFVNIQVFFKDSFCLEYLIDSDAKGTKRSAKILATKFYMSFFTNIFFVHEPAKYSFSTYVVLKGFILVVSTLCVT